MLANAKRVLPDDVRQRAREHFAWLGGISGTARDLDVYQIEWPEYTADLDATATAALVPLREHLGVERQAAHAELTSSPRRAAAEGMERVARQSGLAGSSAIAASSMEKTVARRSAGPTG